MGRGRRKMGMWMPCGSSFFAARDPQSRQAPTNYQNQRATPYSMRQACSKLSRGLRGNSASPGTGGASRSSPKRAPATSAAYSCATREHPAVTIRPARRSSTTKRRSIRGRGRGRPMTCRGCWASSRPHRHPTAIWRALRRADRSSHLSRSPLGRAADLRVRPRSLWRPWQRAMCSRRWPHGNAVRHLNWC